MAHVPSFAQRLANEYRLAWVIAQNADSHPGIAAGAPRRISAGAYETQASGGP